MKTKSNSKKIKKTKKIKALIKKIDGFFNEQTTTPTQREYSNFIADLQYELKELINKK